MTILTLSLLALPVGATGQSPDEAPAVDNETTEPVYVTWSGDFAGFLDVPGEPEYFPGYYRMFEGNRATQTSEYPRISGEYTTVYLVDRNGVDRRHTSLVRIENDEGAWQGPLTNVFLPDQLWVQYGWLKGEGAYEGLSFFTSFRGDAGDSHHVGEGIDLAGRSTARAGPGTSGGRLRELTRRYRRLRPVPGGGVVVRRSGRELHAERATRSLVEVGLHEAAVGTRRDAALPAPEQPPLTNSSRDHRGPAHRSTVALRGGAGACRCRAGRHRRCGLRRRGRLHPVPV